MKASQLVISRIYKQIRGEIVSYLEYSGRDGDTYHFVNWGMTRRCVQGFARLNSAQVEELQETNQP